MIFKLFKPKRLFLIVTIIIQNNKIINIIYHFHIMYIREITGKPPSRLLKHRPNSCEDKQYTI